MAAVDYQCVDFDKGSLPSAWTQTIAGSGTMSVSTARADSTPDSLVTAVTANSADTATLTWNDPAAATSITSLSLVAAIDPATPPQVVPPGSGGMDLLKIASGGDTVTLDYTVDGTSGTGATGYTGLLVSWRFIGSSAVSGQCPVSVNLTINAWNTVELDLSLSTGVVTVIINGTTATAGCQAVASTDTVATMSVGPNSPPASAPFSSLDTFGWTGYFDNIQSAVLR